MAERARGAGVSFFGVILGAVEMILGAFIISFATYFNMMVAEVTKLPAYMMPAYIGGLLGATGSLIIFGGVFVLLHAVKRIVDQAFMIYIASKKAPTSPPPPPR